MSSEEIKNKLIKQLNWEDQKIRVPVRFAGAQIPICMDLPTNVATIKDTNNSDWDIKEGKKSTGKIIPTNKLFEKSGIGNKRKPDIKPTMIERYAVFSSNFLL